MHGTHVSTDQVGSLLQSQVDSFRSIIRVASIEYYSSGGMPFCVLESTWFVLVSFRFFLFLLSFFAVRVFIRFFNLVLSFLTSNPSSLGSFFSTSIPLSLVHRFLLHSSLSLSYSSPRLFRFLLGSLVRLKFLIHLLLVPSFARLILICLDHLSSFRSCGQPCTSGRLAFSPPQPSSLFLPRTRAAAAVEAPAPQEVAIRGIFPLRTAHHVAALCGAAGGPAFDRSGARPRNRM